MENYEILKQLGSGSFGRVVQVRQWGNPKLIAIKMIKMTALSQKEKDGAMN